MNKTAKDILMYYGVADMNETARDILMHYGMPRRSGRYPWGSGDSPYQHSGDFLSRVEALKTSGMSEAEIAKSLNLSTTQLRSYKAIASSERRSLKVETAKSLRSDGLSTQKIAEQMGIPESTVRSLLNDNSAARMYQAQKTAEHLKQQIEEKGMIDVGAGSQYSLNISREKLEEALSILEAEGYPVYGASVAQLTNPGKQTIIKVVCPPGTEHREIYNYDEIHSITDYTSHDGGDTFDPTFVYPKSMDSSRVKIRYSEEGGSDKDGLIEIRRGVDDLSLGDSHYAQVRILVDNDRYMKGMAIYSDDMPSGCDVVYNSNKKLGTPPRDVFKKISDDPDNPFGSLIKAGIVDPNDPEKREGGQSYYYDKDGNRQLSLINKRAEEGDWGAWSKNLPSQFLSKQRKDLIDKQLNLSLASRQEEYDEICSLTNPTIKKNLLKSFADECDSAAVHLKAAALPRQQYQVIVPITTLKDDEVYAPNYKDGETVALVRYPHGGTFEIPILKVNNKHKDASKILGSTPADAIGINKNVADRLSGADFDGDTVMVIPTGGKVKITSTPKLKGLEGFDTKLNYGADNVTVDEQGHEHYFRNGVEYRRITKSQTTQTEMGKVSNLITDMTVKGASKDELAQAVRHSMVVIDAEKHKLDYKQSELDNNIAYLKKRYQGTVDDNGRYHEGASTLISRASSEQSVLKRKGSPQIDPETGKQTYKQVVEEYVDKNGKLKVRTQKSTRMAETDDAFSLVSDAKKPQEIAYATYANKLKAMGNDARKEMLATGKIKYDAQAKAVYQQEVKSLNSKLRVALMNAPRERQAQLLANTEVSAKQKDNPNLTKEQLKKIKNQSLVKARATVGAKREAIVISDKEWDAIQAGAVSENVLTQILNNTDVDKLRQRATPRATTAPSQAKINKIQAMKQSGYTTNEIAEAVGVSSTTVSKYIRGKE